MIATALTIDDRSLPELRGTALHEASHAVLAVLFGCRLQHATIVPTADSWGSVTCHPPLDPVRHIALLTCGYVAELRFGQKRMHIPDTEPDMARLANLLGSIYPNGRPTTPREFVEGTLLAAKLVKQHRRAIKRIAAVLLVRNTLDGNTIRRLMQNGGKRHAATR